ncbi:MAG: bifunctional diaminohydroxyphosphoribosylaminopyrimidine deaminase/5-amino-6-(5-phosphoribosylamino)uracil reductase RibD [Acidobacteria bacterium]|nr:bifunctional diaminohydroxyphosphoribosylaminopyrimidine deaminase/5-amino-6-(5-phosphoribosylamino)uracil reductase RibD [Acidobacteriota bacterium]
MARALALAERGRGRTSPNPMVGAVVIDREGVVVGSGFHEAAGGPHAEVHALRDAGPRARGATLYCTLEPCSHVGRTAACAPVVAEAGIARVVVASGDPNPLVNGQGLEILRQRGISVTSGVLDPDARTLNAPFFMVMTRRRPFVTMKVAVSADHRTAARPGVRTPLTGPAAARLIHRDRAEVDAIAVGSETVLADDPSLTARGAYRYDSRLRTPPTARLLSTLEAGPVIIMSTQSMVETARERAGALTAAGAEILPLEEGATLAGAVKRLASRGVSSMIVEGGVTLHRSFWDAGLVDRVQVYMTPHVLGPDGPEWLPFPLPGLGPVATRQLGTDMLAEAYVHRSD